MNQEELYSHYEKTLTTTKFNHCTWPVSQKSLEKAVKLKEDNTIEFKAIDETALIRLYDNGIIFEVEYLQVLKNKKPIWVSKPQTETQSRNEYSSTKELIRDIVYKREANKESSNVLKLGFEYVRVKKIFSIFDFPVRWSYPLFVVSQKFQEIYNRKGFSPRFHPSYPEVFKQFMSGLTDGVVEDPDLFNSEVSEIGILSVGSDAIINELPNVQNGLSDEEKESKVLTFNDVWQKDNVNPLSNLYRNDDKLHYQFSDDFMVWLIEGSEALIWVQVDNSLILSSKEGNFYTHFYKNCKLTLDQEQNYETCEYKFSKDTVALITRSKKTSDAYSLQEVISDVVKIIEKRKLNAFEEKTTNIKAVVEESNAKEYYKTLPFESIDQRRNEHGLFEAFKNRSIKVVFKDRTVLRINFAEEFASILTRLGDQIRIRVDSPQEFEYYVHVALEYYDDVFMDAQSKLQRADETSYRNDMINYELEKNQRLLSIVSNSSQSLKFDPMAYSGNNFYDKENEPRSFNQSRYIEDNSSSFDFEEMNKKIQE